MGYFWQPVSDEKSLDEIFRNIDCKYTLRSTNEWHKAEGVKVYGYFSTDGNYATDMLFKFSQTILREDLPKPKPSTTNIFSMLEQYGSSKGYFGLKDAWGELILPNRYNSIELLFETEVQVYFLVKRISTFGVVNGEGKTIVPVRYERIFYAGEYTIGFVENGMVGFMSLDGKVVIPSIYEDAEGYNYFSDGRALARLANNENACDHYMNHFGNVVGYPEYYDDHYGFLGSTAYRGDSDILDAYEGDSSNMWNTD